MYDSPTLSRFGYFLSTSSFRDAKIVAFLRFSIIFYEVCTMLVIKEGSPLYRGRSKFLTSSNVMIDFKYS